MEILLTACLLVVPVLTVVALALTLVNMRKVKAMRELLLKYMQMEGKRSKRSEKDMAVDAFMVSEI